MGDLTRNFNLSEFRCKDGTGVPPEYLCNVRVLATNLQVIRAKIGQPLVIVSGYRTPEHNRTCGGATNSYHLSAQAADIRCGGLSRSIARRYPGPNRQRVHPRRRTGTL